MRSTDTIRLAVLTLSLAALGGCGSPIGGSASGPAPSHGGRLLDLPDQSGFVELMVEGEAPKAKGQRVQGKVVAYFTGKGGDAALEPAPTDVVFIDEGGKRHPLSATTAGRFESTSLSLAPGEPTGTLEAKVGGQSISLANRPR